MNVAYTNAVVLNPVLRDPLSCLFEMFPAPTLLIQMHVRYQSSKELDNPFI